jgi:hypothetical protein
LEKSPIQQFRSFAIKRPPVDEMHGKKQAEPESSAVFYERF